MMKTSIAILIVGLCLLVGCKTLPAQKTTGQLQFEKLVLPATRIVVRTGGPCHRDPETEVTLLDSTNAQDVSDWIGRFDVDIDKSVVTGKVEIVEEIDDDGEVFRFEKVPIIMRGICGCCGSHTFSFMQGTNTLLTFSLHHMTHIRTDRIYRGGDIDLLPESCKRIEDALKQLENPNTH